MRSSAWSFVLAGCACALAAHAPTSSKRGLVYTQAVPANGQQVWFTNSDLTWYYNYGATPLESFNHSKFEFVPMLWGAGSLYAGFYNTVSGLIKAGHKIHHVLGFNEPDLCGNTGGSCVPATKAAQIWKREIQPLKKFGLRLGAPAVSNVGLDWLHDFVEACTGCTIDFIPLHWYGDYEAFVNYLHLVRQKYPGKHLWVTEFGIPKVSVNEAQHFYNQSVAHLDNAANLTHYSYFGSFRASDAAAYLGPNGAMLSKSGHLTDIGAWYLGRESTGISP